MTLRIVGLMVIGLSAGLLALITLYYKRGRNYPIRKRQLVKIFTRSQEASIERGLHRQVFLGHQLWSFPYPGLGLHALGVLPVFLKPEATGDGRLSVITADGALAVMARQIADHNYRDGYSPLLTKPGVRINLTGPTPMTFTASFLSGNSGQPYGTLAMLGNYGPESLLWANAVQNRDGMVIAGAGTLTAQAALFASVQHILIGESLYSLPNLIMPNPNRQAGLLTEDILRVLLIISLILGVILKVLGVL